MENDANLFPRRVTVEASPVFAPDTGQNEFLMDKIVDCRKRGWGYQYLVRYVGFGPEHGEWLPGKELETNKALDVWLAGMEE
ncbi:hypothetical protein J132_03774 [Termitomyces sp. J132]|nr:hypothetical protein J132_03774 [Termitomyces sp. J132]